MSREEIPATVGDFNGVKYFIAKYDNTFHVWEYENT